MTRRNGAPQLPQDLKHGALFVACMLMALVTFLTSTGLSLDDIWSIFK